MSVMIAALELMRRSVLIFPLDLSEGSQSIDPATIVISQGKAFVLKASTRIPGEI
jgi:hypothetical protein